MEINRDLVLLTHYMRRLDIGYAKPSQVLQAELHKIFNATAFVLLVASLCGTFMVWLWADKYKMTVYWYVPFMVAAIISVVSLFVSRYKSEDLPSGTFDLLREYKLEKDSFRKVFGFDVDTDDQSLLAERVANDLLNSVRVIEGMPAGTQREILHNVLSIKYQTAARFMRISRKDGVSNTFFYYDDFRDLFRK